MKSTEYKTPSKRKQVKIIDLIIEFCLDYHTRKHTKKPNYANIEREVQKNYNIHSRQLELILNLMVYEKYISEEIDPESEYPVVDHYVHTEKGLSLLFSGVFDKISC